MKKTAKYFIGRNPFFGMFLYSKGKQQSQNMQKTTDERPKKKEESD